MGIGYETKYEIKGTKSSTTLKKHIVCDKTSSNGLSAPGRLEASRSSCLKLFVWYMKLIVDSRGLWAGEIIV